MTVRAALGVVLAALLVTATAMVTGSGAAFSVADSNPSNAFGAAAKFPFVATGSYTGNGVNARTISGLSFRPDVVIVKANTAQVATMRTSTMSGDASKPLAGATALAAGQIESLNATGFTLGTNAAVNSNGVTYQWVAFRANPDVLSVGSYTGTGAARSISSLAFSPEYVITVAANASNAVQRFTGMSNGYRFDADGTGQTQTITALNSNGFSVGTNAQANANGVAYHYVAINAVAGQTGVGTYTGNNTDNRNLTGLGFQPDYVTVHAGNTSGPAREGAQHPASLAGDSTQTFSATANAADKIQSLSADGFQVGKDASVNANMVDYYYLAAKQP